jgi:hypothetical protein
MNFFARIVSEIVADARPALLPFTRYDVSPPASPLTEVVVISGDYAPDYGFSKRACQGATAPHENSVKYSYTTDGSRR